MSEILARHENYFLQIVMHNFTNSNDSRIKEIAGNISYLWAEANYRSEYPL